MSEQPRFEEPNTLPPPRVIGRLVRLVTGPLYGMVVFQVMQTARNMIATRHQIGQLDTSLWLVTVIGIYVLPDVMNIGFGRAWRPFYIRSGVITVSALAAGAALLFTSSPIGLPLTVALNAFLLYTFGHLGTSLLLATVLATLGCEMRAIPHSWGMITGRPTKEYYCPGFLTPLDSWEYARNRQGNR